jgi:hypothetical protein
MRLPKPHKAASWTSRAPAGEITANAGDPSRIAQGTMLAEATAQVTGSHLRSSRPNTTPVRATSGDITAVT